MMNNCPRCGYLDLRLKCDYCGHIHDNEYFENADNQLSAGASCFKCHKGHLCAKGARGNP